jgi:hypothetical protein
MFGFPLQLVVVDVFVIHLASAPFAGGAAHTPSFAPAARGASKGRACQHVFSAQPFDRLWALALTLLGDMSDQAVQASRPGLSWAAFMSGAPGA